MKANINRLVVGCLLAAWVGFSSVQARGAAANRPAEKVDYGKEVARWVNEKDEVVSKLENGMVVIAKRVATPVVAVRGYVWAGSVYEGRWLGGGLSHLLEHLVAGGSNGRRSEAENRDLLQQIGNDSNAYTTTSYTAYFVNTTAGNLEKAVDLVSGWLLTAKITPEEYRREYEVVQRELEMGKGEPMRAFYYNMQRNRYHVSPARVPTIGYQAVIQGLSRDDVYAYYKEAYQPNNIVFVVAGDLEPEVMLKAVQKYVADAPPGRVFSHDIAPEPPVIGPRTLVDTFPRLGQARLQLGFPSIQLTHPDLYALDLLAAILGQGESSILVEELRDKQQLVSSVSASSDTPHYVDGTFTIDMELPPDKLDEAKAAVMAQIQQIKKEGVSAERLQSAKTQVRTARAFRQQTSQAVAESMATDFLATGDPHFSDRYVERMQAVSGEQVKAMAEKYLDASRLITTALIPEEAAGAGGLAGAEKMLRAVAPTTQPDALPAASSQVTRAELKDGTILLLKRVPTAPIVSINLYSLGGITAEDAQSNGLGNLALQAAPRGTTTRSAQQIAQFFDSIGGDLNTACGNNTWNWQATCMKEDLGKTLEVVADVVYNPTFPDLQTALIKRRTLAAIAGQDANWMAQSLRFFRKTYFGAKNEPYQFMPIGTKENVERFTPEQVRQWYQTKVLGAPRVLAIFGDIDIAQAKALAEARFQGPPVKATSALAAGGNSPANPPANAPRVPSLQVRKVAVQKTDNAQAGIIIGFDSATVVGQKSNYPLAVGDTMASGYSYPTGYLHEILRGRGLVYMVHAVAFPGRSEQHPGAFLVYAGCEPEKVNEVVEVILQNIARLQGREADLNADWFARAKQLIVTGDALENETAADQAQTAALDELFGLGYDYHTHFADRINAVQLSQVQTTARQLLRECVVTINTSHPELVKVKEGERKYESLPPVELTPGGVRHEMSGKE